MYKSRYRPRHPRRTFTARARRLFVLTSLVAAIVVFCLIYLEFYHYEAPEETQVAEMEQERETPAMVRPGDDEGGELAGRQEQEEPREREIQGQINPGDTAGKLLLQWLNNNEVAALLEACKDVYGLEKVRVGQPYVVTLDKEGVFVRFEYEVNRDQRLIVVRDGEGFAARLEEIAYDIFLQRIKGQIDSNLFATMSDLGEGAQLAVRLSEIFAWEIDFIRHIQPGDSFQVLVEKRYRDGEFSGYGKLLMAVFTNRGKEFQAYCFQDKEGYTSYYDEDGGSMKRAFLKAPLSFTRISSRFTTKRFHPILKTWRAHPAVDYAAPSGTPVLAIGNGQVNFSGWGKGAGNYVVLRHANGYESMYLHLKGFAKGIKKGVRVDQGQIIGYVGSTGYSTGPHLDFRIKKNGSFVNPESTLSPKAEPVNTAELPSFEAERDLWRLYMEGKKELAEYSDKDESQESATIAN